MLAFGGGALGTITPGATAAPQAAPAKRMAREEEPRPNIVLIVLDDVRSDDLAAMPAVQSLLAEQGASFVSYFVPTPICGPSRATLLRGQYAHNTGVRRNTGEDAGFAAFHNGGMERENLATLLHDAGYETGLIGKYLNGYGSLDNPAITLPQSYVPPGWDTWVAGVGHTAYANYDYRLNVNGRLVDRGDDEADYLTDVLAEYAVEFVDRAAREDRPFFLYLAPYAPHAPATPAPRHETMFLGASAPRGPAFNETEAADKPAWIRDSRPMNERRIAKIDEDYRRRLESLQAVDEMLAAVFAALETHDALDSSYVFLVSDNGYFLGEHRQPNGKDAPYDPVTRVPLIARGPGIAAGSRIAQIAVITDLLPTIAELADRPPPAFVDGRSLTPLWMERAPPWRQTVLFEGFGKDSETGEAPASEAPPFRALRSADVLYAEYQTGERELYDLRADPQLLENWVGGETPKRMDALAAHLVTLGSCAAAGCRLAEDVAAAGVPPRS